MTKFNRTQKFTKANIANVPQDKAIIYKIKSRGGENLYTGIAGRGRSQDRLIEHKDIKKEQIPEGTRFQYAQVKTKVRAHHVGQANDLDRRLKEHLDFDNEQNECLVEQLKKYHAEFSFAEASAQNDRDGAEKALYDFYTPICNDEDAIPNGPDIEINPR